MTRWGRETARLTALCAVVLGLATSCGGKAQGDGIAGGSDEEIAASEELGRLVARARCACTEVRLRTVDRDACIAEQEAAWFDSVVVSVRAGRARIAPEADYEQCLSLLEGCGVQSTREAPCSFLFEGDLDVDARCLGNWECETGFCDWDESGLCAAGHCATPLPEGEECFLNDYECETGLACVPPGGVVGTGEPNHCAVPGGIGEPCVGCEPGLVCRYEMGSRLCGIQRSEGEPCGFDGGNVGYATPLGECGPGLDCMFPSFSCEVVPDVPADRQAPGESCIISGPTVMTCGAGTECINGRCEVPRRAGEPCEEDSECAAYTCVDNVCRDALYNLACDGEQ
jgi:hypothetical protein